MKVIEKQKEYIAIRDVYSEIGLTQVGKYIDEKNISWEEDYICRHKQLLIKYDDYEEIVHSNDVILVDESKKIRILTEKEFKENFIEIKEI